MIKIDLPGGGASLGWHCPGDAQPGLHCEETSDKSNMRSSLLKKGGFIKNTGVRKDKKLRSGSRWKENKVNDKHTKGPWAACCTGGRKCYEEIIRSGDKTGGELAAYIQAVCLCLQFWVLVEVLWTFLRVRVFAQTSAFISLGWIPKSRVAGT